MTVARKPGHRGERVIRRKTIARGMPGVCRCDLTTRVLNSTISAHAAIGRIGRPAFPAPSFRRGRNEQAKTRARHAARSRICVFVIARSEATKQSTLSLLPYGLLRFARN